jgi:hypothetical protein
MARCLFAGWSRCGPAAPSFEVHGKYRAGGCSFRVLLVLADQGIDCPRRLGRVGNDPSTTVRAHPPQRRPVLAEVIHE